MADLRLAPVERPIRGYQADEESNDDKAGEIPLASLEPPEPQCWKCGAYFKGTFLEHESDLSHRRALNNENFAVGNTFDAFNEMLSNRRLSKERILKEQKVQAKH